MLSFDPNIAGLPQSAFPEVLEFLVLDPGAASYPSLPTHDYSLILELWRRDPKRLMNLARIALDDENSSIAGPIVESLSHVPDVDRLMTSVSGWPTVRRALVLSNPELLKWSGLSTVEPCELVALLDALAVECLTSMGIIKGLLNSPSFEVADYLCKRFPSEVLKEVCIGRGSQGVGFQANEFILQRAGEMAPNFLSDTFLVSLGSTSALSSFASMLGFINSRTIEVGALSWARSLRSVSNDMGEPEAHLLRSFLLGLALARPERGCEYLFEYSFDPLHRAMRNSVLPYEASIILEPQLPDVSWWERWDNCHRLRAAVVKAYVHADLDPSSFLRLSTDADLMSKLFEIMESEYRMRRYLAKVRAALDSPSAKRDSDTTSV
jgi:hypothetical protein